MSSLEEKNKKLEANEIDKLRLVEEAKTERSMIEAQKKIDAANAAMEAQERKHDLNREASIQRVALKHKAKLSELERKNEARHGRISAMIEQKSGSKSTVSRFQHKQSDSIRV